MNASHDWSNGYRLKTAVNNSAMFRIVLFACTSVAVFILFAACQSDLPTRVLFIGNSYTFINGGLDKQLQGLAPSTETKVLALGGYTLERHWNDGNALAIIREGKWDYVVLQEQSQVPVLNRSKFFEFAQKFDEEIRRVGARTILLMTWERPDSKNVGVTTDGLASAYTALGRELRVSVAPAGLAFAQSLRERPELILNMPDGHPTVEGTYLAACVLYRTIYQLSPVDNDYADKKISTETRDYLQRIAAGNIGY